MGKRIAVFVLAIMLCLNGMPPYALAEALEESDVLVNETSLDVSAQAEEEDAIVSSEEQPNANATAGDGNEKNETTSDSATDDVPEWAIDDGQDEDTREVTAQAALPSTYDLRTEGLVTPVKFQNPWGSCWSFGGIAAAETSILSAYGTTYAASKLDLSERHLIQFALSPVTAAVNAAQAGEGVHLYSTDRNAAFNTGGQPIHITTLFAQGIGPVSEARFPYRGKEAKLDVWETASQYGTIATYNSDDDWSIPETDEYGNSNRQINEGLVLKNGNVLPQYWNSDKTSNEAGKTAIKQEILNGRAVSIAFWCDQTGQFANSTTEGGSLFCQYIPDVGGYVNIATDGTTVMKDVSNTIDHAVCIVGWDDNYPASNFTHTTAGKTQTGADIPILGSSGNALDETAATALTTPKHDGAWIVKNSYGSTKEAEEDELGNIVNRFTYGIKEDGEYTGYFYLSYEDASIRQPESMEFSSNLYNGEGFYTAQYDYMPAVSGFLSIPNSLVAQGITDAPDPTKTLSSANVFVADEAMELRSVSTRTSEENMRVTQAIYLLDDDAVDPTSGKLAYRTSKSYEHAGFHRLDLERPLRLEKGQRYSIVSTTSILNNSGNREYSISVAMGISEDMAKQNSLNYYDDAVVNQGESYIYADGTWTDWSAYRTGKLADCNKYFPLDNFAIKAYAVPVESHLVRIVAQAATCTEGGCIEHYYDSETGKYYADADGTQEITWQDTYVAPLGHSWNAGTVTKKATAIKAGAKTLTCERCGATKEEQIPATVKKGKKYKVSGNTYKVTSNTAKKRTVTLTKAKNAKKVTVPASVKINGATYKVTGIGSKAFSKAKKVRTITVKTKKLTKSSVKNSMKGSKVSTIKVKVGKKSQNKKYVEKYAKVFAKANCGKEVTIK